MATTATLIIHPPRSSSPLAMSPTPQSAVSSSAASYKTATSSVHTVTTPMALEAVHVGPPPPSPPASVDQEEVEPFLTASPVQASIDTKASHQTLRPIVTAAAASPPPLNLVESPQTIIYAEPTSTITQFESPPHASSSTATSMKPARRNTTGSAPTTPKQRRFNSSHNPRGSQNTFAFDDSVIGDVELEEDIELHADQIRRERMSKRVKQQQQQQQQETAAGASLTRQGSKSSQDRPLVGNLIGEGHVNYVLMYNMLTGIRVGVSEQFRFDCSG